MHLKVLLVQQRSFVRFIRDKNLKKKKLKKNCKKIANFDKSSYGVVNITVENKNSNFTFCDIKNKKIKIGNPLFEFVRSIQNLRYAKNKGAYILQELIVKIKIVLVYNLLVIFSCLHDFFSNVQEMFFIHISTVKFEIWSVQK